MTHSPDRSSGSAPVIRRSASPSVDHTHGVRAARTRPGGAQVQPARRRQQPVDAPGTRSVSEPARPPLGRVPQRRVWTDPDLSAEPRNDRMADREAERALLHRMVDGLGMRLVSLGNNRQLVVRNVSMSLSVDELTVLARLMLSEELTRPATRHGPGPMPMLIGASAQARGEAGGQPAGEPPHLFPPRPFQVASPLGGGRPPSRGASCRRIFRRLTACSLDPGPPILGRDNGDHGAPDERLRPLGRHSLRPPVRTGGRPIRSCGQHSHVQPPAVGIRQPVTADPAAAPASSSRRGTVGMDHPLRVRVPVMHETVVGG